MAKTVVLVDLTEELATYRELTAGKVRTVKSACPHCGQRYDGAAGAVDKEKEPVPGDLAICISCGGWSQFGEDMRKHLPDEAAQAWIATDPTAIEATRRVHELSESSKAKARVAAEALMNDGAIGFAGWERKK